MFSSIQKGEGMKKKVNTLVALAICAGLAAPTVMQADMPGDFRNIYDYCYESSLQFASGQAQRQTSTNKCVEQYTLFACVVSADCSLYKKGQYYKKKSDDATSAAPGI